MTAALSVAWPHGTLAEAQFEKASAMTIRPGLNMRAAELASWDKALIADRSKGMELATQDLLLRDSAGGAEGLLRTSDDPIADFGGDARAVARFGIPFRGGQLASELTVSASLSDEAYASLRSENPSTVVAHIRAAKEDSRAIFYDVLGRGGTLLGTAVLGRSIAAVDNEDHIALAYGVEVIYTPSGRGQKADTEIAQFALSRTLEWQMEHDLAALATSCGNEREVRICAGINVVDRSDNGILSSRTCDHLKAYLSDWTHYFPNVDARISPQYVVAQQERHEFENYRLDDGDSLTMSP